MDEVVSRQLAHWRANADRLKREKKKQYHAWKETGLCTTCGDPVFEGVSRSMCKYHHEAYRAREAAKALKLAKMKAVYEASLGAVTQMIEQDPALAPDNKSLDGKPDGGAE